MKDDKIIRAVSDIDDAYILEAAPDSVSRRGRRYAGVIAGLAAAAVLAATGLFAFGIIFGRTGSSEKAADAAVYDMEKDMQEIAADNIAEEKEYMLEETAAAPAYSETRAASAAGTYAAADVEAPADTVGEENAAGVKTEAVTEDDGTEMVFEAAKMPDGVYYVLVYSAENRIRVIEEPEDFPLLAVGEADGATLFRAEKRPAELTLEITQENGEIGLYTVGPEDEQEISEFFRNWIREADE